MELPLLLLLCCFALLFGCAMLGVPQKDYDSLKASCTDEKQSLQSDLSAEKDTSAQSAQRLLDCTNAKQALDTRIASKDSEISRLRKEEAILQEAMKKTDQIAAYQLALEYYNDAFGPGGVPNTYRMAQIGSQLQLLSDPKLPPLWNSVRNCGGLSDCEDAKAAFVSAIQAKEASLAVDVVGIVKGKNVTAGG